MRPVSNAVSEAIARTYSVEKLLNLAVARESELEKTPAETTLESDRDTDSAPQLGRHLDLRV